MNDQNFEYEPVVVLKKNDEPPKVKTTDDKGYVLALMTCEDLEIIEKTLKQHYLHKVKSRELARKKSEKAGKKAKYRYVVYNDILANIYIIGKKVSEETIEVIFDNRTKVANNNFVNTIEVAMENLKIALTEKEK